jgi:glucokinase
MPSLCIDFGGTAIKVGLLEGSHFVGTCELPSNGVEADLVTTSNAARSLLADAGPTSTGLTGVGVAMPGVVDRRQGCLVAAHDKYGYAIDMDIRAWAQAEFGVPAAIENDARAALLGEASFGCAAGEKDAVLILLGTGIGTAALVGGRLFRGAHDHGGILGGHVTVQLDGPACNCGNVGCAEAVASTWAIERALREQPRLSGSPWWEERLARGRVEIKDLLESQQEAVSRDVLDLFLRAWGAAIVTLCHAYDPNVVVVSGGVMRSAEKILPRLTEYVGEHLWSSSHRPQLLTPAAPEHSVLLGLSVLASEAAQGGKPRDRK